MAFRTNDYAVRDIIDTDPAQSLRPFMASANAIVNWLATQDTIGELTSDLLLQIETWLAAHFYAHKDQLYQQKMTGRASGQFQGQTAMVFQSTTYGQTACALDVSNRLAQRSADAQDGKSRKVGIRWMGTTSPPAGWPPADYQG